MGYRTLAECTRDLQAHGQLVSIEAEIDPYLEAGAIQRRVFQAGGPALLFPRVKGTPFPMIGNLFGTLERTRFLFRDTLEAVRRLVELKVNPPEAFKHPWRYRGVPATALHLLPRRVRRGPILAAATTLDRLPQLQSWPRDGGAFVTLPQVYTEDPDRPGWRGRTWGCTGSRSRGTRTSRIAKPGCTTRSIAGSACTTRRRSGGASRSG